MYPVAMLLAQRGEIPLSPVFILTYVLVLGFLYFFTALFLDLPLPGAKRRSEMDEEPEPRQREHERAAGGRRRRSDEQS